MTFHVLYNDCHLEADTGRERKGGRGGGGKRDKKEGQKEGGGGPQMARVTFDSGRYNLTVPAFFNEENATASPSPLAGGSLAALRRITR